MPTVILTEQKTPKYDGSIRAKLFTFLSKLQADDTTKGLHIEPMNQAVDSRARTGRVDDMWRAVLFKIGGGDDATYVLEGVYPHDEAIKRARTRRLRLNPVNALPEFSTEEPAADDSETPLEQAQQLAAKKQHEIEAAQKKAAEAIASGLITEPILVRYGYQETELIGQLGFTAEEAALLLAARDEAELTELVDQFENAWQEMAVIAMIDHMPVDEIVAHLRGEHLVEDEPQPAATEQRSQPEAAVDIEHTTATIPDEKDEDAKLIAGLRSPAASKQFHYVDNQDELRRVIESGDFGKWTVFLHPDQEHYVRRNYRGVFRLTGGAGTGKTVILLHRARRLALGNPNARIVLTTFTRALSRMLARDLKRLDSRVPIAPELGQPGIYVAGVDQLIAEVRNRETATFNSASEQVLGASAEHGRPDGNDEQAWEEALSIVRGQLDPAIANRSFFNDEYLGVVLPARINDVGGYLRVPRPGSGQRLGRVQRMRIWQAIEQYRQSRRIDQLISFDELAAVAAVTLERTGPLVDHVLVDEGQDLSAPKWQFLRALTADGPNDLFIAEDSHQRIYGRPVIMSRAGIDLRGRSRRLKLNYRTTQETLDFALHALSGEEWKNVEGQNESTEGYISARRGPEPRLVKVPSRHDTDALAEVLQQWLDAGVQPNTIAVLVRRKSESNQIVEGLKQHGITARFVVADDVASATNAVVMTMHSAKGQEFSRVVLHDMSKGRFPLPPRSGATHDEIRETSRLESALLYVAATRARDELVVTYSGELTPLLADVADDGS